MAISITSVLFVVGLLLVMGYFWYLLAQSPPPPQPNDQLEYVSFELNQDNVPFEVGSSLTVFGLTITATDADVVGMNEVKVSNDYNEQWRHLFAAFLAAEISPGVPFKGRYTVSFGFYMTVRELMPLHIPAAPEGLFNNAISVYEIGTKEYAV